MHNNYHFLKPLTASLNSWLSGECIELCYSQAKNELIITTQHGKILKAHFDPSFSCLSFPAEHKRAHKNSVNLFPEIIGRGIMDVQLHKNERAFSLILAGSLMLTFKLFGNRSNILLFRDTRLLSVFRSSLKQDLELTPESFDRTVDLSLEAFIEAGEDPVKFCPTLGRQVREYLKDQGFEAAGTKEKYRWLMQFITELSEPPFFITEKGGRLVLSLYEDGNIRASHVSAMDALNDYYSVYIREGQLNRERKQALDRTGREIDKIIRYIDKSTLTLQKLKQEGKYRELADLIMANLHVFSNGKTSAVLADFYNENAPVEVVLKHGVSPQKYAEQLYRKSRNQHIQVEKLEENISLKRKELQVLKTRLASISVAESVRELRGITGKPDSKTTAGGEVTLPYRKLVIEGFEIWIGKNAKSNDAMLRLCHKNDLWLHAKDVSGSHVIIRQRPGLGFPHSVKERAAELAAYHSRRKQDSLCPVIITQRKYVRKRKGDPAGMVRVDREEKVLLVQPRA